jgi:hypothetical protein
MRERIVKVKDAEGRPFDHGLFQLLTEPLDGTGVGAPIPEPPPPESGSHRLIQIEGRVPPTLKLCRGCDQFVKQDAVACPHCGGDIEAFRMQYEADLAEAWTATENLKRVLAENCLLES